MANPTWRYHPELCPKGQIFDADSPQGLPSAEDGWLDTPHFNHIPTVKPVEPPVTGWPDAKNYGSVHVFMSTIEERMPTVPTEEHLRAHGMKSAEKIAETIAGSKDALVDAASSALRYYAVRKYGTELDGRFGPDRLLRECEKLDANGPDAGGVT